jgi:hypothetical protein
MLTLINFLQPASKRSSARHSLLQDTPRQTLCTHKFAGRGSLCVHSAQAANHCPCSPLASARQISHSRSRPSCTKFRCKLYVQAYAALLALVERKDQATRTKTVRARRPSERRQSVATCCGDSAEQLQQRFCIALQAVDIINGLS